MTEEQRIRQQLAQLNHKRQQLSKHTRQLRHRYRQRTTQRLASIDAMVIATLAGAASYWLASLWLRNDDVKGGKRLSQEVRAVAVEFLDRQCKRWTDPVSQRFSPPPQ